MATMPDATVTVKTPAPAPIVSALHLHLSYLVMFVLMACLTFYGVKTWESEHTAKVIAEQQVKASEAQVKTLQQQIAENDARTQAQIATLQQLIKSVKTPVQVVAALPSVLPAPLPVTPTVNADNSINLPAADVLPLFQDLAQCKQDSINLASCKADLSTTQAIVIEKQTEITALKKKPSFWKRIAHDAKVAVFSAIVTAALIH